VLGGFSKRWFRKHGGSAASGCLRFDWARGSGGGSENLKNLFATRFLRL